MTEPKTHTSLFAQARRRSEFIALYDGTYAAVVAELLAFTGDADLAHAVAGASYMRAWQVWPAVRKQARPVMWVRADVVRRIRRRPLTQRMLKQQMPSTPQVHLDDEDSALLARLRWLTKAQRLPVVLHYMADVPIDVLADWCGGTAEDVTEQIVAGLDALTSVIDWYDDGAAPDTHGSGELDTDTLENPSTAHAYAWTAAALADSAERLRQRISVPALVLPPRHATLRGAALRSVPLMTAAATCVGVLVYVSPAPPSLAAPPSRLTPPAQALTPSMEPEEVVSPLLGTPRSGTVMRAPILVNEATTGQPAAPAGAAPTVVAQNGATRSAKNPTGVSTSATATPASTSTTTSSIGTSTTTSTTATTPTASPAGTSGTGTATTGATTNAPPVTSPPVTTSTTTSLSEATSISESTTSITEPTTISETTTSPPVTSPPVTPSTTTSLSEPTSVSESTTSITEPTTISETTTSLPEPTTSAPEAPTTTLAPEITNVVFVDNVAPQIGPTEPVTTDSTAPTETNVPSDVVTTTSAPPPDTVDGPDH